MLKRKAVTNTQAYYDPATVIVQDRGYKLLWLKRIPKMSKLVSLLLSATFTVLDKKHLLSM